MKKLFIAAFYGLLFTFMLVWAYTSSKDSIKSFLASNSVQKHSASAQSVLPSEYINVKGSTSAATTADVVAKANILINMVTSSQLSSLVQTFNTTLEKKWSNLPCGSMCRNGLEFVNMTTAQLTAAKQVIAAALGTATNEGYDEFMQIVTADSILNLSSSNSNTYSSGFYFICFLNVPTTTGAWMLQIGGHHYAANIAFNGGNVVGVTPRFEGVEPKTFNAKNYIGDGSTVGYAPISQERNAMAYMLSLLSTSQLATAKNSSTFSDVTLAPGETNGGSGTFPTTKVGLAVSTLNSTQQAAVLNAMQPWLKDVDDASYAALNSVYTNEINSMYITYTGNGTSGDSSSFLNSNTNYVRLDGTSVWIEFICQNGVVFSNQIHYHSVWRDHTRDYGSNLTSTVLPLTLLNLEATSSGINRLISWKTTNETGVDHFEIQRTTDEGTVNFSIIANITAKNTGLTTAYSYIDAASIASDVVYYRLKMVDTDGSVTYSKTVSLKNGLSFFTGVTLYPNPATSQLKVSIAQTFNNANLKIINAHGKTVMTVENVFGTQTNINISSLATGIYNLQIVNNDTRSSTKFLKLNSN